MGWIAGRFGVVRRSFQAMKLHRCLAHGFAVGAVATLASPGANIDRNIYLSGIGVNLYGPRSLVPPMEPLMVSSEALWISSRRAGREISQGWDFPRFRLCSNRNKVTRGAPNSEKRCWFAFLAYEDCLVFILRARGSRRTYAPT
jgi:hypothetical protein